MTDIITSLQNPRVKLAYGLQTRPRTRRKERKIALEGAKLIRDALERGQHPDFVLYDPRQADYELIAALQEARADIAPASPEVMAHLTDTETPQGIIAIFPLPLPKLPSQASRILILDAISDPGNVGTILRTAAAAGVEVAIFAPNTVDPYNPKVLRAGMGAHFRIPIAEAPWHDIAAYCQHAQIFLADAKGQQRYDRADWTRPYALIIGNEGHGASKKAQDIAQTTIYIPMAAATESLNAAISAAVILFEAARQRSST